MDTVELTIHISSQWAGEKESIRFSTQIITDLKQQSILNVRYAPLGLDRGAKSGTGLDWSTVLVTLAASGGVLTTIINLIQTRLTKDDRRSVVMEIKGNKLTLSGIPPEEQTKLITSWLSEVNKDSK